MKQSISLLLAGLTCFCLNSGCQETKKPATSAETATQNLERLYNAGNYDSLIVLFTPEMGRLLQRQNFFPGLFRQAGKITARELSKTEQRFSIYRTQFERGIFALKLSVDEKGLIDGMLVTPFVDESLPRMTRNSTPMQLPFRGEWTVVWGGDTREQNYHVVVPAQRNAFDLVITDERGKTYRGNGESNEDYYAFGQEIISPCDAQVEAVVDSVADNKPGVMNTASVPGNYVLLRTAAGEYILLAHLKHGSIRVNAGQQLKNGDLIGICGNSGNSSEPHLHFHVQNGKDLNTSLGVKCFFERLLVNGRPKSDHSPVRGEKISNTP